MKKSLLLLYVVLLLFAACNNATKENHEKKDGTILGVKTQGFRTKTGKEFVVNIDKSMGASMNEVSIEPQNFSITNEKYDLGAVDPVDEIFLADLDQNGFEEIYVITRSVGSGSYATIYGMASNKDKSATPVYVPPISENQLKSGELFDGFMGHNTFKLEAGKLYMEFPVYKENDSNAKPSGEKQRVEYQLKAGEAGWILELKAS
jgi:hypothetical protein